ncbi:DJ-1_PfpI domain-containing protein [Penicillium ucsense]|uniref:DJ-1_PfpI domain-containing protein n=1 Tax=Penicillium ucsense TaxID=2839758 RepID=A0A8J8WHY3_9EURO|nr:DJ-1_PfpI domain-containing protein [Penicillium ucsense]KAF7739489.1 DJ-1_PfpI domain-containing protein [Penicillium ucsense]
MTTSKVAPQPLRIGVLLVNCVQLLDLAALDLLFMTSPEWLADINMPQEILEMGRPCEIYYITREGPNTHAPVTCQLSIQVTHSLKDAAVAPGALDILFVPGPPPRVMPPAEEYLEYTRQHNSAGTTIMTVCTGALVAAHAGITKGRVATAPRFLIENVKKAFPEAKIWDETLRVTRDGNLWMSGGVTNGHDLVAEYIRMHYPEPVVNVVLGTADVAPRALKYDA